jgi:hypothetical protein
VVDASILAGGCEAFAPTGASGFGECAETQHSRALPEFSALTPRVTADTYATLFRQAVSFARRHGIPESAKLLEDVVFQPSLRHQPR